jgi:hypothetical protein
MVWKMSRVRFKYCTVRGMYNAARLLPVLLAHQPLKVHLRVVRERRDVLLRLPQSVRATW